MKTTFPYVEDGVRCDNKAQLKILRKNSISEIQDLIAAYVDIRRALRGYIIAIRAGREKVKSVVSERNAIDMSGPKNIIRDARITGLNYSEARAIRRVEDATRNVRRLWRRYRDAQSCIALWPRMEEAQTEWDIWQKTTGRKCILAKHENDRRLANDYRNYQDE